MKTATLMTGASGGMGCAIARQLLDSGQNLLCHYWPQAGELEKLKSENGDRVELLAADLSCTNGIAALVEKLQAIMDAGTEINRYVHLPALPPKPERFRNFSSEAFQRDLSVQLFSCIEICKSLVPAMAKRKYGRVAIMLTSYVLGVPPKFLSPYVTAKYALTGLMKSLAAEYAGAGVTVNGFAPSMTATPFLSELSDLAVEAEAKANPLGRLCTPEDIAPFVDFILSDEASYVTGAVLPITAGSVF